MTRSHLSIQQFFAREVPHSDPIEAPSHQAGPDEPGDGFSAEEKAIALDPLLRPFSPTRDYHEFFIGDLQGGSVPVTFIGRVVNFAIFHGKSKFHASATGWYNLILKDDKGAIFIKLYFAGVSYNIKLGTLLTVWTPHVAAERPSPTKDDRYAIPCCPISTSIFPGRESTVHMQIHCNTDDGSLCRKPIDYTPEQPLPGLMSLKTFINGGHEIPNPKVLVCVKSIGPKKSFTTKKGTPLELISIEVFDELGSLTLKLWKDMIASAREFEASETILLISNPAYRIDKYGHHNTLGISHASMIEIDPVFEDAIWLRNYVAQLRKKESVKQEFPEGVWDVGLEEKVLYTIAEVDTAVRQAPDQIFTGMLNVILVEMSLVLLRQRHMLMCTECCGVPIYSNEPTASCQNCSKQLSLSLNPKIIGTVVDESGSIAAGKLLWSPRAWEALFGRSVKDLVALESKDTRLMEQRLSFMRFTLVFGWSESVGRLTVLYVWP